MFSIVLESSDDELTWEECPHSEQTEETSAKQGAVVEMETTPATSGAVRDVETTPATSGAVRDMETTSLG